MKINITIIICGLLLLHNLKADPLADKISDIIRSASNCNIIISADKVLPHLNPNDVVPVEIYYHSLCKKEDSYCPKARPKELLRRFTRCTHIIFAVTDKTEFAVQWKLASEMQLVDGVMPSLTTNRKWDAKMKFDQTKDTITYHIIAADGQEHYYMMK
jgi:hypothetical protein